MSNPRIPKSERTIRIAGWVNYENIPWRADDTMEWTYQRPEGDLTILARTAEEALEAMGSHGFKNLDRKKLRLTGGKLTDYLKKEEIK